MKTNAAAEQMKVETWINYARATASTGVDLAGARVGAGEKFKEINFVTDRGFERDAGEGEPRPCLMPDERRSEKYPGPASDNSRKHSAIAVDSANVAWF